MTTWVIYFLSCAAFKRSWTWLWTRYPHVYCRS